MREFTPKLLILAIVLVISILLLPSAFAQAGPDVRGQFSLGNLAPTAPSNFSIQDNSVLCAGQTDEWDQTDNTTHMDYHFGALLNWTKGVDKNPTDNVTTKLCITSDTSLTCAQLNASLQDDSNAATICDVANHWANESALNETYYNITDTGFAHNGSATIPFTVVARAIDQPKGPQPRAASVNMTCYSLSIINDIPSGSTDFRANYSGTNLTHLNGTEEIYNWSAATDLDTTPAKDHCPPDTIVHNLYIGTSYGDGSYYLGTVADPAAGINLQNGIPYNATVNADFTFNSTIFVMIRADDSVGGNETPSYNTSFTLFNTIPTSPTSFTLTSTHNQSPPVNWTASVDPESDNIYYYITAGTTYGGTDLLAMQTQLNILGNDTFWNTVIPWGTDNLTLGYSNETIYITIWAIDNLSSGANPAYTANRSGLDAQFVLGNHLPDVTTIELTDSAGYSDCAVGCAITPLTHSNATNISIRINATDYDNDCNITGNGYATIYLCGYTVTEGVCDSTNYNWSWQMEIVTSDGSNCAYELVNNLTSANNTMPFWLPNSTSYQFYVNVSDQVMQRPDSASDLEVNGTWIYNELTAIDYPTFVLLGGGVVTLDIWNNGTQEYNMTNWGNVVVDSEWNSSDPVNVDIPTETWVLNGSNMQLDDDPYANDEPSLVLPEVYIDNTLDWFDYSTGLQRCISDLCGDPIQNESMPTHWHIAPSNISAGTYNSTIIYVTYRHV